MILIYLKKDKKQNEKIIHQIRFQIQKYLFH
jgi:hypothetical protein